LSKKLEERLKRLSEFQNDTLLQGGLKGIEKEGLRVTLDGHIASTPHPKSLGSALTHPYITTDYSEALLELITPPFAETTETLEFLTDVHHFVYANIGEELMWAASMPCLLEDEESIPIAEYGTSNIGKMKHIYRRGLAWRYGRAMQAIAGVHFNYSVPERFWPVFQQMEGDDRVLQDFVSESYMALIRNFQRIGWIVSYLFGASPSVCPSFIKLRKIEFPDFNEAACQRPYATSLRMSDIGYKNSNQDVIVVSYNTLDEYVESLMKATRTPCEAYKKIGVVVDGEYRQLNANILQIENEYYSFVRPKQIAESCETPSHALENRGVRYVEIRAIDVNPFDPIGVNELQMNFMEVLLLFCLLEESPLMDKAERDEFERNQSLTACRGRDPELKLTKADREIPIKDWVMEILERMKPVCALLEEQGDRRYTEAVEAQMDKVRDSSLLPASQVIAGMEKADQSFFRFALERSEEHKEFFLQRPVPEKRFTWFRELAEQSLNEQQALEAVEQPPFDQFLQKILQGDCI